MISNINLTPREAAFVLDENLKVVAKVLQGQSGRKRRVERRGGSPGSLSEFDLLFFLAVRDAGDHLTAAGRKRLFDALRKVEPSKRKSVTFGPLSIDLTQCKAELRTRLQRYVDLRKSVEFPQADADPLIKGTTIEVHRIGALFDGGLSLEEVMEAYPSLTQEQIENARRYALANPEHRHVYPKASIKKLFKSGLLRHMKEALAEAERDE